MAPINLIASSAITTQNPLSSLEEDNSLQTKPVVRTSQDTGKRSSFSVSSEIIDSNQQQNEQKRRKSHTAVYRNERLEAGEMLFRDFCVRKKYVKPQNQKKAPETTTQTTTECV